MFGDTDVPAASQSGIVNETLGCSAVHDAMGIVWHNEAHTYTKSAVSHSLRSTRTGYKC